MIYYNCQSVRSRTYVSRSHRSLEWLLLFFGVICDERREQPKKHEPIVGSAFDQWKRAANGGERRRVRAGSALLGWAFVSVRVRVSLPLRTGRVRCYILDYTDAKNFEVINGAQHGCGRVVNGPNAACISSVVVTSWLRRGVRVVSRCRTFVGGRLHVAAGGMTSSSVGVGGVARV